MPDKVTVREDLQIIQVDSYGDVTANDLMQSMETVMNIQRERGISKVFVDATKQTSMPSTMPVFEFGSKLAQNAGALRFAVAVLQNTKEKVGFLETVARNRGAQFKIFDSTEAALAWLMK
jgi:hypothetical protein